MNLLDTRPKSNREDFYGRTEQLASLFRYVGGREPLVVVSGLRRVGKTSLVKTALTSIENGIFVDAFKLGAMETVTKSDVWDLFKNPIQAFLDRHRSKKDQMSKFLNSVSGISVGAAGAGLQFNRPRMTEHDLIALFDALNAWGVNNDETVVLAVDEAQEFARAADIDLAKIFSSFYSYENVVIIMTGSKIGLLHDFIRTDDADGAFYGRGRMDIALDPLNFEESRDFLDRALAGVGTNVQAKDGTGAAAAVARGAILNEAASELGGLVGWLVRFGRLCKENGEIKGEFVGLVREEGSVQARTEFCRFLHQSGLQRTRYEDLVRVLAGKNLKYGEFETYLQDEDMANCAVRLTKEGFLKTDERGRYSFSDPMLAHAFRGNPS